MRARLPRLGPVRYGPPDEGMGVQVREGRE